ncbi:MAG TPA: cytochrome c [Clostridia bacterium]|nr:cytochrome c [Clostridia bacterium]
MRVFLKSATMLLLLGFLVGCQVERRKSDQELGLNAEQARGRRVYDNQCIRCHEPYSSRELHGPSLAKTYKKPYLPSGIPVNDDRMRDVILMGKTKMPAFNQTLTEKQLQDLLAYLKTL